MAKGYWGFGMKICRCCQAGPKSKFYCPACDHVAKAPHGGTPHCPFCREPMADMGDKWRPGKKGKRSMKYSRPASVAMWASVTGPEARARRLLKQWGG